MEKLKHNYLEDLKYDLNLIGKDIEEVETIINRINGYTTLEEYLESQSCTDLDDLYSIYSKDYDKYENGEITLEDCHELILAEVKEDERRYYEANAKWDEYKNQYVSLNSLQNHYFDKKEELENNEKKFKEVLEIIERIPNSLIKSIETSRKSISTYVTCYTKDYPVIIEELRELVDNDEIDNALGTEFEFDDEIFTIRISDHAVGSYFNETLGYYCDYSDSEISIIL